MDSTDNKPTVSYTFEELGLTPTYVKASLEDLARDQLDLEAGIASAKRNSLIGAGLAVVALGGVFFTTKIIKSLAGSMQVLGQNMLAMQEHMGMVGAPVVPQEPVQNGKVEQSDTVDVGSGYDPGPQPVPDSVREAVESMPVSDIVDEPGL